MKTSFLLSTFVLALSSALVLATSTSTNRRLARRRGAMIPQSGLNPEDKRRRVNARSVLYFEYINNRLVPTGEMTPAVRVTSRSMSFSQFCSSVSVSIYAAA
jgi:hypothetical protein